MHETTISTATTVLHSFSSCHVSNVASWMGRGRGSQKQALLPGKHVSDQTKLCWSGPLATESFHEANHSGQSSGSQMVLISTTIKKPVPLDGLDCLGLKIRFFLILVEPNIHSLSFFFLLKNTMKLVRFMLWTPGTSNFVDWKGTCGYEVWASLFPLPRARLFF